MKKRLLCLLLAGSAWALPAMDDGFVKGQLFISALPAPAN